MRKTIAVAALLLLGVGWVAKPFDWVRGNPAIAIAQATDATATPPAGEPPARVELLTPGTDPKNRLRYRATANTTQSAVLTMDQTLTTTVGDQTRSKVDVPQTVVTMETTVTQVDPNGDIHYQFRYTNVDVLPKSATAAALTATLRSQLNKLKSLRGSFILDAQGQSKSGSFTLPSNADPSLHQVLDQLSQSISQLSPSRLPTEAVGVGATWRVANMVTINGINLQRSATYKLVSVKDGVATIEVQVDQQANQQPLKLPAGGTATLKSLTAQGRGQSIVNLNNVFAYKSAIALQSTSQMAVQDPKTSRVVNIATQAAVQIQLESK